MFLHPSRKFSVEDFWTRPYEKRLHHLRQGKVRVAYFSERPSWATYRYRGHNMVQALESYSEDVSAACFTVADMVHGDEFLEGLHTLVIVRSSHGVPLETLIHKARRRGVRVLFDIDDLIFDPKFSLLLLTASNYPVLNSHHASSLGIRYWDSTSHFVLGNLCEGVITTNEFLSSKAKEIFNLPTYSIPNFLNAEQIFISEYLFHDKLAQNFKNRDHQIHLGYFSGSMTHHLDFALLEEALAKLMKADKRIKLRLAGHLENRSLLSTVSDQIETLEYQHYVNLQSSISEMELNLAPLQNNAFSNSKSELKFFEAAIVGSITAASPRFCFQRGIEDGVNSFLASAHRWDEVLQEAIYLPHEDYVKMAMAGRQTALNQYNFATMGAQIAQTLDLPVEATPSNSLLPKSLAQTVDAIYGEDEAAKEHFRQIYTANRGA